MKPELDPYYPKKRVHIATPAYDGKVHNGYAQSVIVAAQECYRQGIEVSSSIPSNGAFIEDIRNILVKQFLEETDATHLMWIDADLAFPANAIAGLVHSNLPVAAGVYRQREEKIRYVVRVENDLFNVNNGWLQVERCPGGFMCIRREVLETMGGLAESVDYGDRGIAKAIYKKTLDRDGDNYKPRGEDIYFCDEYTKLWKEGVFDQPIWVWPDIDFNHAGYRGNLHEFLLAQRDKWEAQGIGTASRAAEA